MSQAPEAKESAEQDASTTTTLFEAWGDWVNPREYLYDDPTFGPVGHGIGTGRIEDREDGKQRPIIENDHDLDEIRAAARLVVDVSGHASGALRNLTNYVIGTGFCYEVMPEKKSGNRALSEAVRVVVEDFLDRSDWCGDFERELFQRSRVDGEFFLGLWHVDDGKVVCRAIDPEQVQDPGIVPNYDRSTSFGIDTSADDMEDVAGYWIKWSKDTPTLPYAKEGDEEIAAIEHTKLNVVRKVKRGLSDFFCIDSDFQGARKLLRNMVRGTSIQAAIPFIRQHPAGVTSSQVETARAARATNVTNMTDSRGIARTSYGSEYRAGTVLDIPKGLEYKGSPLANGEAARSFIEVLQAALRSLGTRWSMPEYMISGDASNGNYASSLVAESPFVKSCEAEQSLYKRRFLRIIWQVVRVACEAGRIPASYEQAKREVTIEVETPQIATRDATQETNRRQSLVNGGVMSRKTWAAQEGLDYDQEQENRLAEARTQQTIMPMLGGPAVPGQQFGQPEQPGQLGQLGQQPGQQAGQSSPQQSQRSDQQDPVVRSAAQSAIESVRTLDQARSILRRFYP